MHEYLLTISEYSLIFEVNFTYWNLHRYTFARSSSLGVLLERNSLTRGSRRVFLTYTYVKKICFQMLNAFDVFTLEKYTYGGRRTHKYNVRILLKYIVMNYSHIVACDANILLKNPRV